MNTLPDEVFHQIVNHLEIKDIARLSSVSEQLNIMVKRYNKPLLIEPLPKGKEHYKNGSLLRHMLLNYKTYKVTTDINDFIYVFIFADNLTNINIDRKVGDAETLLDIMIRYSTKRMGSGQSRYPFLEICFDVNFPWRRIPTKKIRELCKIMSNVNVWKNICNCNIHKPINLKKYKKICIDCHSDDIVNNTKNGPECEECSVKCDCNNYAVDVCDCGGAYCAECCAVGKCLYCHREDVLN